VKVIFEDTRVLDPEEEGTALFLNVSSYLATGTAYHAGNLECS